jgi:LysR family transcriptional regulator, hydrogen peroxide-inducible genes activator
MEMHQIRYFLTVAEELNFTRAAERCNVAQPSISRAIKMLEAELGGPLLHRERGNTNLSELGRMMKPYLEQVYREAENAKQQAADFTQLRKTPLRLGLMCTIAPDHLIDFIKAVLQRQQGISLQISDASAEELEMALLSGEREVAIYAMPSKPKEERLHYIPLYEEEFVLVVPRNHPICRHAVVPIAALNGERYLSRINCEYGSSIDHIFDEQNVDWPSVYESERDDWILAMVAAGLGLAFMPRLCVRHPGVEMRPLSPSFSREVALVTVRGRPRSPAAGALVAEAMRTPWLGKPALAVREMIISREDEEGPEQPAG